MKDLLWVIPLFPLAGFLINGILGRRFSKTLVNAIAVRPMRVGRMQSNMSTPAFTAAMMSRGIPTPIR